jgi:BirA family biotin operon repressor/biotin-[acetyl-CoA-carboxylase] ligase
MIIDYKKKSLIGKHTCSSWPGRIFEYQNLPSTNTFLLNNLMKFSPFDLVWAHHQTNGRGRIGKQWISLPNSSLTFSLLLKFDENKKKIHFDNQNDLIKKCTTLSQVIAFSWNKVFHKLGLITNLKWPNDILYKKKKLFGLLVENKWYRENFYIIMGMGINISGEKILQQSLGEKVTCLDVHLDITWDLLSLLKMFLKLFYSDWCLWKNYGFKPFVQEWKKQSNLIGQQVLLKTATNKEIVRITDIDKEGYLWVTKKNNQQQKIVFGEIVI